MGRAGFRSGLLLTGPMVFALLFGTSAAARPELRVTLKLGGTASRSAGESVTLIAAAKLPARARLVVRALRAGRTTTVRECTASPCAATYRSGTKATVQFQALATTRTGKKTTILGASPRVTVSWTAAAVTPTPPAPVPTATPGHYEGKTADNELFAFDVSSDSATLTNLRTGQMNQSCAPPTITLFGGNLNFPGPYAIDRDGGFTLSSTFTGRLQESNGGTVPTTNVLKITGRIADGKASGTYREDTSFTMSDGHAFTCSTGDQTWNAAKT